MEVTEMFSGTWQLFCLEKGRESIQGIYKDIASFSTFYLLYGANLCADPCI
jgi:hypothetical protein